MSDPVADSMERLRREIRKSAEAELREASREAAAKGKYCWNGMWLTPEQVRKAIRLLDRNDRIIFVELIAFFIGSLFVIYGVLTVLGSLLP